MFNKNKINKWINFFAKSDNAEDIKKYAREPLDPVRPFLKRDLVEAKIQVDRWGVVTNHWIFHTSKKDMIKALFPVEGSSVTSRGLKEALKTIAKYAAVLENLSLDTSFIDDELKEKLQSIAEEPFYIWGGTVDFTDDISPDTGIGLALDDSKLMSNDSGNVANSIVIFNVWNVQ